LTSFLKISGKVFTRFSHSVQNLLPGFCITETGTITRWRLRSRLAVGLHLNRRLRSQGIHDLDAVIVALKSWTTGLLSSTSFTLNFVIRNSYSQSSLPGLQRFLRMIVAEVELTSGDRSGLRFKCSSVYELKAVNRLPVQELSTVNGPSPRFKYSPTTPNLVDQEVPHRRIAPGHGCRRSHAS
jgi:hypothetical protein